MRHLNIRIVHWEGPQDAEIIDDDTGEALCFEWIQFDKLTANLLWEGRGMLTDLDPEASPTLIKEEVLVTVRAGKKVIVRMTANPYVDEEPLRLSPNTAKAD